MNKPREFWIRPTEDQDFICEYDVTKSEHVGEWIKVREVIANENPFKPQDFSDNAESMFGMLTYSDAAQIANIVLEKKRQA